MYSREILTGLVPSLTVDNSGLALSLVVLCVASFLRLCYRASAYPPGPSTLFLLYHGLQTSADKPWITFSELGKKYGPIVNLSLVGGGVLVLNAAEDAEELLTRRSLNYSSRKLVVFSGKYKSNNKRILLLPYGLELRRQRAAYHFMLQTSSEVADSYESLEQLRSCDLLLKLIGHPQDLETNLLRYAASIIFTLAYGKQLKDNDEDLNALMGLVESFSEDCRPGAHLVDTFPILDSLPDILAPWRNDARMKHCKELEFYIRLLSEAKEAIDCGSSQTDCFAARLLGDHGNLKLDTESLAYVLGTAVEAGTDTTAITLLWFIMAMLTYPECMKRAQEEIDSVFGADGQSMPGFAHMDALPYCFALTKEVFRWRPAVPLGFPHYSEDDDLYKVYKIRAKTTVIPNIWAMHHDKTRYPDPLVFNPERFYKKGSYLINTNSVALTEDHYTFGFGRRICPGKHLGSKVVWIAIVRILWAFDITHEVDANGKGVPVDPNSSTLGILSKPTKFPARFAARSSRHIETIRREHEVAAP